MVAEPGRWFTAGGGDAVSRLEFRVLGAAMARSSDHISDHRSFGRRWETDSGRRGGRGAALAVGRSKRQATSDGRRGDLLGRRRGGATNQRRKRRGGEAEPPVVART
jgi:hypothetical protein